MRSARVQICTFISKSSIRHSGALESTLDSLANHLNLSATVDADTPCHDGTPMENMRSIKRIAMLRAFISRNIVDIQDTQRL